MCFCHIVCNWRCQRNRIMCVWFDAKKSRDKKSKRHSLPLHPISPSKKNSYTHLPDIYTHIHTSTHIHTHTSLPRKKTPQKWGHNERKSLKICKLIPIFFSSDAIVVLNKPQSVCFIPCRKIHKIINV